MVGILNGIGSMLKEQWAQGALKVRKPGTLDLKISVDVADNEEGTKERVQVVLESKLATKSV